MVRTRFFFLGLWSLGCVVACDTQSDCINCDPNDEVMLDPVACEELTTAADDFLAENRACETALDCSVVEAGCYVGAVPTSCRTLAVSSNVEAWAAEWTEFAQVCECPEITSECESRAVCSAGQCMAVSVGIDYCQAIAAEVQAFLTANLACEADEDCQAIQSTCYGDQCRFTAMNAGADTNAWAFLDQALAQCEADDGYQGEYCTEFAGDCGSQVRCGADGMCTTDP